MSLISNILQKTSYKSTWIDFSDRSTYKGSSFTGLTFSNSSDAIRPKFGTCSNYSSLSNDPIYTQTFAQTTDGKLFMRLENKTRFSVNIGTASLSSKTLFFVYRQRRVDNLLPIYNGSTSDVAVDWLENGYEHIWSGNLFWTLAYNSSTIIFDVFTIDHVAYGYSFDISLTVDIRSNSGTINVIPNSGTIISSNINISWIDPQEQRVDFSFMFQNVSEQIYTYQTAMNFIIPYQFYNNCPLFIGTSQESISLSLKVEYFEFGSGIYNGIVDSSDSSYFQDYDTDDWVVFSYRTLSQINEVSEFIVNGNVPTIGSPQIRKNINNISPLPNGYSLFFNCIPNLPNELTSDYRSLAKLDIGEIIIVDGYLSNADFYSIDSYLNKKWKY